MTSRSSTFSVHSTSRPHLRLAREKSVFDERDIAKVAHRHINDAGTFEAGAAFHAVVDRIGYYEGGRYYAGALRDASNRGLHAIRVARTLISDQRRWVIRQTARRDDRRRIKRPLRLQSSAGVNRSWLPTSSPSAY